MQCILNFVLNVGKERWRPTFFLVCSVNYFQKKVVCTTKHHSANSGMHMATVYDFQIENLRKTIQNIKVNM